MQTFDWIWAITKVDRRDRCEHIEVHKVRIPAYSEKGHYFQLLSLDAFIHNGIKEKNRGCWSPDFLYVGKRWGEFEAECQRLQEQAQRSRYELPDDRKLPRIEHESIWDFYKAVGYDYKKKKWATA